MGDGLAVQTLGHFGESGADDGIEHVHVLHLLVIIAHGGRNEAVDSALFGEIAGAFERSHEVEDSTR